MASTRPVSAEPRPVEPDRWYLGRTALLNRCNLSPWALAAQGFQDHPRPLEIAWVRQEHRGLLEVLDRLPDPAERAELFHHYVMTRFWAHEDRAAWPSERERLRHSYVAVLRGWGIDSNGASGAVLKGWAENRFGLRPIWHRTALSDADASERYAAERMRGATAGIGMQLDLLYTYCQDELARRHPCDRWLTLYRGSQDAESYVIKTGAGRAPSGGGGIESAQPMPPLFPRSAEETEPRQSPGVGLEGRRGEAPEEIVEFNNVSSFTSDREVAWEFGSRVWEVRVPVPKIVYCSGLLPNGLLQGECEHIVLGGDYRVRALVA